MIAQVTQPDDLSQSKFPGPCLENFSDGDPCFLLWKHVVISNHPSTSLGTPVPGSTSDESQAWPSRSWEPGEEADTYERFIQSKEVSALKKLPCSVTSVWAARLLSPLFAADIAEGPFPPS